MGVEPFLLFLETGECRGENFGSEFYWHGDQCFSSRVTCSNDDCTSEYVQNSGREIAKLNIFNRLSLHVHRAGIKGCGAQRKVFGHADPVGNSLLGEIDCQVDNRHRLGMEFAKDLCPAGNARVFRLQVVSEIRGDIPEVISSIILCDIRADL